MITKNKPYLNKSKQKWIENEELIEEFKKVSGIDLRDYKDLAGFDIMSLDQKEINTPDNVAMSDYVEEKWGKKYRDLIADLI